MAASGVRMARTVGVLALAAVASAAPLPAGRGAPQSADPVVPVGVVYQRSADPVETHRHLDEMQRLRFTVVLLRDPASLPLAPPSSSAPPLWVGRLLAGDSVERAAVRSEAAPALVAVSSAAQLTADAWLALARGARGVLFDDWTRLQKDPAALREAEEFAAHLSRNAALYAPLLPRSAPGDVRVEPAQAGIEAAFLESSAALVLIAVNRTPERQRAVLTFSAAFPEAIWQNMLTGGAVNFVAGPDGPVYTHTFAPRDVLVLMIQKKWR